MSGVFTSDRGQHPRLESGPMDDETRLKKEGGAAIIERVSQQYSSTQNSTSKGCILIVDDNDFVREILAELLESDGYEARLAGNAAEALRILHNSPNIDVLVTDLTMPGGDGITLIRQARERRHDLPAILLTGYAEQVKELTALAVGRFSVLSKPVESDRLIDQLERLMKPVNAQHHHAERNVQSVSIMRSDKKIDY